jgi:hypothetical protein
VTNQNETRKVRESIFLTFLSLLLLAGACWGQSQSALTITDFGMQCGQDATANCKANGLGVITLPTEPGMLRLWDSEVEWSALNPSCSTPPCTNWNWTSLDEYLYAIASDPTSPAVIYTFGWVPCWDASSCSDATNHRTDEPPSDLGTGGCGTGSCTFNSFVTALTTHCAPAKTGFSSVCVKDVIKYYEMWNEADNSAVFWAGTVPQLYNMVKPAVGIIQTKVSGAVILTPSVDANGESWMASWIGEEVSNTIISNRYNFHAYLETSSPEVRWQNVVAPGTSSSPGLLYPNYHTSGWTALPWMVTETNFRDASYLSSAYTCDTTNFPNPQDCPGQIVRWQILLNANGWSAPASTYGATNVSWYNWNETIGDLGSGTIYATPYYYMLQYMKGGTFTSSCAATAGSYDTFACPFTESGSTSALWVWTNSEASGLTYTISAGVYADYKDLAGNTTAISNTATTVPISVEPILLEQ